MDRRLAAILAADVVGYSRLMGASEAGTLAALKTHRRELVDGKIAEHHGRIVKLTGDGMLVEFPSVVNAVACAVEIQRRMVERNAGIPGDRRIEFRIGVNLGDIIVEDNDIFGDGVNVAARIEGITQPGGVCVSGSVRENVGNRLELAFEDMGEQALKNIERPVRVYNVSLGTPAPLSSSTPQAQAEAAPKAKPSIAVLPFNNMSGDPEQEYFSDGITEDIITDLSKISALSVIARNSVFTYKGKPTDVQEVSRRFNVASVLEGSVRKAGQRVRITAQLVNGQDGVHLWADRFDRELTDIFAIQDEITKTIVEQLKVKLLPAEKAVIAQTPTENMEAYTYYLRGRQFFHRHSKSYYLLAKRMFAKAVELDPLYARAYAGIADCDSFLFLHYQVNIPVAEILATAAKALDLESGLAEAHASRALALSLGERHAEAGAEFERAIALNPNLFEGRYFYARACFARGKLDRAAELLEQALAIRPDDYQSQILLIPIYRSLGRKSDVSEAARRGLELAQRELVANPENPRPAYLGAGALVELGESTRAREWAARALAIDPDDILTQYNIACLYSLLGDIDAAIGMLERLLPHANHETKAWIKHDSDLAPLHSHPYWQKVLALTT
jgi:adenylate cyclase